MSKKRVQNLKFLIPIFLSLFFVVFYIFQIGLLIEKSYLLSNYENQLKDLSEENRNLTLDFARLASLENINDIDNYTRTSEFEKIAKIDYIRLFKNAVAAK